MTIKRVINGIETEITLTDRELWEAYEEEQHKCDLSDIENAFEDLADDDLIEDYGVTREKIEELKEAMELTEAGERKFVEVLGFDATFYYNGYDNIVLIDVDDENEAEFERKLAAAKELFESMAGWCTVDEGREWFKEW